jgi:putative CocE/NonD family hydrolase
MVSANSMTAPRRIARIFLAFALMFSVLVAAQEPALRDAFPQDEFVVREEMVAMRDGVKLYTLIITPKKSTSALPIILKRTPYDASGALGGRISSHLDVTLSSEFLGNDYIYVFQDVRGRFSSEGDYFMYRAPRGVFNKTESDETTDAWDTVDWLVNNLDSNGKVGIWGNSYPGWLTLAATRDPHPAVAAAVPLNPVVDVWKADDWFHWGAFRAYYAFDFIYVMETQMDSYEYYPYDTPDMYTWLLGKGSAAEGIGALLDDRHEMWSRIIENPSYGPYWQDVAADQWFDQPSRLVPTLHVHSFWDQEDIYGSPAVYAALEKHDSNNDMNFFVAGPWRHGQHFSDGSRLGDINFDQDTAKRYREDILRPFLRRYLHGEDDIEIPPVSVFESGENRWRTFDKWPPEGVTARLYLQEDGGLAFSEPTAASEGTEFSSDPDSPVPFAPRPNWPVESDIPGASDKWRQWLVEDQRFVDGRPDVVTWVSDPLDEAVTIRGAVSAHVFAETTGTDADWVVKLIDVYPDDADGGVMSGYQLMISGDIFRGRYREDINEAKPIAANEVLEYTMPLPHVNHTLLPGHRLMIQIQSSWFPLYDRNPQTFVPSIMFAPDTAYQEQQHRIHHGSANATYIEFRVDKQP